MFRSLGVIALAVGLVFSCSAGQAQDQLNPTVNKQPTTESNTKESGTASGESSQKHQTKPIDPTPSLEGIESAIRDLIAEEDKIEHERQIQRENDDLHAQTEMAKWAFWMFVATAATVVLTFIALFAILRTLHHTKRAADYTEGMLSEAKATTKAAQDTVKVTREMGQAETRAYVQYESIRLDVKFGNLIYEKEYKFQPSVKNTGQTPARITSMYTVITNIPPDDDGFVNVKIERTTVGEVNQEIGSGTNFKVKTESLNLKSIGDYLKSGTRLFILAHVEYSHIFSKEESTDFTQFCFEIFLDKNIVNIGSSIDDKTLQDLVDFTAYARFRFELVDETVE